MLSITRSTVNIPDGIKIVVHNRVISIEGRHGLLSYNMHEFITIKQFNKYLIVSSSVDVKNNDVFVGTTCALLRNMIIGVSQFFIKKLQLIGIGYRVILKNEILILSIGLSHAINYIVPMGITACCLSSTEIEIKGIDKQLVGQVAANIRGLRPPDPFKGKGIRYFNESICNKEIKKR